MIPLRNVILQNASRAVSDDVNLDLPVNPLYCILYTLRFSQNAASTTADVMPSIANALAMVTKLEVLFRGSAVMSGSLTDLAILHGIWTNMYPFIDDLTDGTGQALAITIPIFLGRPSRKGSECFPPVRKGELTLHRVFASSFTNITSNSVTEQVETYELLGATPKAFLKATTISKTMVTTGDNDIDLPLGNPLIAALCFGTTGFNNLTSVATFNKTKLLVDNVEYFYALTNWESLNGELNRWLTRAHDLQTHTHLENLAATYTQDVGTGKARTSTSLLTNYGLLNFDPFDDDMYLLQTAGRGRVNLRVTAGTADASRVIPVELISVPGQTAGT